MNPLYIIGAVLGTLATSFIVAFALMKDKKESIGFDRNMKDIDILKRLLKYARPYWRQFLFVILLVAFTIASDIVLPLILGDVASTLGQIGFEYKLVLRDALIYFGVLAISLACTFIMAVILQKTGQRIISTMRQQLFVHIENLSHSQLNAIPVGKLVTRVCNDTNSVSMMFTGILVNLVKNIFLTAGFLVAMFAVNVKLTLIVLCFVPFIVLFTVIFRKFSRKAYRKVKNNMTDINTYLSENLSGIKVTQSFNQEQSVREKEQGTRQVAQPRNLRVRRLPPMCLRSVYLLGHRNALGGRQRYDKSSQFCRAGDFVCDDCHLLSIYSVLLYAYTKPCRTVQPYAVGICVKCKDIRNPRYAT